MTDKCYNLFRRFSVDDQESVTTNLFSEDTMRPLRSSFYTDIPNSFVEYIINEGASKGGLEFEMEKEVYFVYVRFFFFFNIMIFLQRSMN